MTLHLPLEDEAGSGDKAHTYKDSRCCVTAHQVMYVSYEGWNFNSGNYLFTTDTK